MASLYMEAHKKPTSLYKDRRYQGDEGERQELLKRSTTLYVGNLSFYTSEEQIFEVFSKAGEIKRIIMGLDRLKRTPCGFCFVEYYTRKDAEASVLHLSGLKLDERLIRVDYDVGFTANRQFGRGRSGGQVRDEYRTDYDPGRGGYGQSNRMTGMEMWGNSGDSGPPGGPPPSRRHDGRDMNAPRGRGGRGGYGPPRNGRGGGGPRNYRRGGYNQGGPGSYRGDRRSSYPPNRYPPNAGHKRRRDSNDDGGGRRYDRPYGGGPDRRGDGHGPDRRGDGPGRRGDGPDRRGDSHDRQGDPRDERGGPPMGDGPPVRVNGAPMESGPPTGNGEARDGQTRMDDSGGAGTSDFVVDKSRDGEPTSTRAGDDEGGERPAKQQRREGTDPAQSGDRFNRGPRDED